MLNISIPHGANEIIKILNGSGFEAYVVGGCVRDSILGIEPHDWDICTSATPDKILAMCAERNIKTIETGLKHGTVTVIVNGMSYEVTTFRADGEYTDHRRPDSVRFISSIEMDLSRRDFTMNAMAYSRDTGLIDPFGGLTALKNETIACVGDPMKRFREDALRMMRALRFAANYNFSIDEITASAIHSYSHALNNIAMERINSELCKLLLSSQESILYVLEEFSDVIATIIPEMKPCIGFEQNNRFHQYNVYEHIVHAVYNYSGDDLSVKIALLLHDIGKPCCYTEDENGGHFYGHGVFSHDISRQVLDRLRFDNERKKEVLELVLYHDSVIEPTHRVVRRWLNKIGEKRFRQLLCVRMADIEAHAKGTQESRIERCSALHSILDEVIEQEQCFSMKDLFINGNDVMSFGISQGKTVGDVLNHILDMVISEDLPNERDVLLEEAQRYIREVYS